MLPVSFNEYIALLSHEFSECLAFWKIFLNSLCDSFTEMKGLSGFHLY